MILIIQLPQEKLHYFEFVKPIEDVLRKNNIEFRSIPYKSLDENIFLNIDKIIISGTSLKDNRFLKDLEYFRWIKNLDKPTLGICGGMHILGLLFNGELKKQQEIGLTKINFEKEFLRLSGSVEVYELHNYFVEPEDFNIIAKSNYCIQAIKHKTKPLYGILFHPEVRNKNLLLNFVNL